MVATPVTSTTIPGYPQINFIRIDSPGQLLPSFLGSGASPLRVESTQ